MVIAFFAGLIAQDKIAGFDGNLAVYFSFFVDVAIDHAAVQFDQIAQQLQVVFTVAVDVHEAGQGEMPLVARIPYREYKFYRRA